MSKASAARLAQLLGSRALEVTDRFGDDTVHVAPGDWLDAARSAATDSEIACDHFLDLTAVDYPEREPELPRFDVVLRVRSTTKRHRLAIRTRVGEAQSLATLATVFPGANWAERECFDMFGIRFADHPDPRRILLYDEFVGHPLRKDYPIDRAQPLVPYREGDDVTKLAPFGIEEGQPFARVRWEDRLTGEDRQVSPSLGLQQGQRRALSDDLIALRQKRALDEKAGG